MKIGIVGCGAIAKNRQAPEFFANPDCEIGGFYDVDPARSAALAAQYGGEAFASLGAMLADAGIDSVSICSANRFHCEQTLAALAAGKNVLCEKPMAMTEEEGEKMAAAAKASGKKLMVAQSQRYDPAHMRAKEILESGALGRVVSFRTEFGHSGPEAWAGYKEGKLFWYFDPAGAGYGALGDIGVHKADLVRWLTGEEVAEVSAFTATTDKKACGRPIPVEDNAAVCLRMANGIVGTMQLSWTQYGRDANSTVICCEKGQVRLYCRPDEAMEVIHADGRCEVFPIKEIWDSYGRHNSGIIDAFVACVVHDTPVPVTAEDGLAAVRVIEACKRSSRENRAVRLKGVK